MPTHRCSIKNCPGLKGEVRLSTFSFPREDSDEFRTWMSATQSNLKFKKSKKYAVCELHFERNCFLGPPGKKWLRTGAVPSIFPNIESAISIPLKDATNEKAPKDAFITPQQVVTITKINKQARGCTATYFESINVSAAADDAHEVESVSDFAMHYPQRYAESSDVSSADDSDSADEIESFGDSATEKECASVAAWPQTDFVQSIQEDAEVDCPQIASVATQECTLVESSEKLSRKTFILSEANCNTNVASALSCVICHSCNPALRFFHAPSDTNRLEEWSKKLNLEIKHSAIICEKHFLAEHFTKNLELNCWRINSRAIPTLHLRAADNDGVKLINEHDFDNKPCEKQNSEGFQHTQQRALIKCLWCDDCFDTPNLSEILEHLKNEHHYEIVSFLETEDEDLVSNDDEDVTMELAQETQGTQEETCALEETSKCDKNAMETDAINEDGFKEVIDNNSSKDENNENAANFEFEQCNLDDNIFAKSKAMSENDSDSDVEVREFAKIFDEMPQNATFDEKITDNEPFSIDVDSSNPELMFYVIDLLRSIPAIWFINYYKSEEYEAGLKSFCQKISEKYQINLMETELHESLIEIRDWYIKMYEKKSFDQLAYPQSEYFGKLTEFLPDKSNGKTCELCGVLFHDHIQYFAHKKLKHAVDDDDDGGGDNGKQCGQVALDYLTKHVANYLYARYPFGQVGFSFQCQNCSAFYGRKQKRFFFGHIKTHLDIRDHVCDICGKAFIKKEHFNVHQKRHLGTHLFACKICGKAYKNCSVLTAHRVRFHRPIEGTIEEIEADCQRALSAQRAEGVSYHYKEDGSRVFACLLCGKTYDIINSLYSHRKRSHPEIKPKPKPRRTDEAKKSKRSTNRRKYSYAFC